MDLRLECGEFCRRCPKANRPTQRSHLLHANDHKYRTIGEKKKNQKWANIEVRGYNTSYHYYLGIIHCRLFYFLSIWLTVVKVVVFDARKGQRKSVGGVLALSQTFGGGGRVQGGGGVFPLGPRARGDQPCLIWYACTKEKIF